VSSLDLDLLSRPGTRQRMKGREAAMLDCYDVDDAATTLLERRWFALSAKIRTLHDQCEVQREVMALAKGTLRDVCAQLADFEALRDALGNSPSHE
jgi:hypothetical protein